VVDIFSGGRGALVEGGGELGSFFWKGVLLSKVGLSKVISVSNKLY